MVALYVHIPFCRSRCAYCAFNTYAGLEALIPAYGEALCAEIRTVAQDLSCDVARDLSCNPQDKSYATADTAQDLSCDVAQDLSCNPQDKSLYGKIRTLRTIGLTQLNKL